MALGRKKDQQHKMFFSFDEMPKSPGHVFYDRLQSILIKNGFIEFVQEQCEPYYAVSGRPTTPWSLIPHAPCRLLRRP